MSYNKTLAMFAPLGAIIEDNNLLRLVTVSNRKVIVFNDTKNITFVIPRFSDLFQSGTLTLSIYGFMETAVSGTCVLNCEVEAVTTGDSLNLDSSESFDTANSATVTVPATTGKQFAVNVTLTNNDSIAAGDCVRIRITKDASSTATGNYYFLGATLIESVSVLQLEAYDQVTFADGSETSPSIAHQGDANNGIYFGTDVLNLVTNGITRLSLSSTNIRLGSTDVASPVAQTLSVQSVLTGTSNTAGTNFTIKGSQGTGTGVGGSIIFQTAAAGSTGSTQNALATALTLDSTLAATFTGTILLNGSSSASQAAFLLNGSVFTGGTTTTNFPHMLIQPSAATAVTSWSKSGTCFGINTISGFAGNFIDLHINGATTVFGVSSTGTITNTGNIQTSGAIFNTRTGTTSNGAIIVSGAWLTTGGTGTTTYPHLKIEPTSTTAVTTWSTSGTCIGINAASGFAGNFLDFHVAGGSSLVSVNSAGTVNAVNFNCTATGVLAYGSRSKIGSPVDGAVSFSNSGATSTAYVSIPSNAQLQLGLADAAAPVAQILSTQSVVTGTSNTAGVDFTIAGSKGTGTGAGGSIIFQTAAAGSTGSSQNSLSTALTIDSTKLATFAGDVSVPTKTPSSASATGVTGTISWDASYIYVCTATNTWKRVAIATW